MYLINTQTYELENVGSRDMYKEYAILSRTWEDGEATFEDMKDLDTARSRLGWHKIQNAPASWLQLKTCDTPGLTHCCIDKSTSAELSEAINSMFRWCMEIRAFGMYTSATFQPNLNKPVRHHRRRNSFTTYRVAVDLQEAGLYKN